ncbi:FAD-dependent monooxygenase [Pseudomaricurvus alkylphenolicus]|uniref:FAD-dependent monooxygenase n=1 Tax=Pseudomaricurvus alkylphenolicus TaxID=1306991 RepID=UPI00141FA694|nr:FAD-dependent monooxygenase [Pseudomaricurvus alkylphenolicus]
MNPSVAIIGGGPAGLVFAISLARRGVSSIIFEAMENPLNIRKYNPSRSYAIDMTGHGLKAIRYIDAVEDFDKALIPFNGMKLNGKTVTNWDESGWIASRGDIVSVLTNIAQERYSDLIDIHFQCQLQNIDVDAGSFDICKSGEKNSEHFGPFDLVVAADGGGSKIREQAAAQEPAYQLTREDIGFYFKMLAMDRNTDNLDASYLQILSKSMLMVAGAINGPGGKGDPLWFSAVPYSCDHRYESLAAVKKDLKKRCPDALKYSSDDALSAFADLPAQNIGRITKSSQLYAGRVVFLGDAAISYPPIGQGINGAMESAKVLDEALIRHSKSGIEMKVAIKRALFDYNASWLPETQAVAWMGKKHNQSNRWHTLRAMALNIFKLDAMTFVKSSTMSYAEALRRSKRLGPIWWG